MASSKEQTAALSRAAVVAAVRGWIGTPYHHQASVRAAGCDCLGLVRGVWRDLYGHDAEQPPGYSRDWAEATGEETLLTAAARHLLPASGPPQPGDVLVFRFRAGVPAKHTGLLATPATFVHAVEGCGVVEVPLVPWWRRRIAGVFSFPGIID